MPTQKTDVSGGLFGIEYAAPGITWKIAKGVSVSGTVVGVSSIFPDSTLINKGTIGGDNGGVVFDLADVPGDFLIKNQKSGHIAAPFPILVRDFVGTVTLKNKGTLDGANAAFQAEGSGRVIVENTGDMFAQLNGLRLKFTTPAGGADIDNFGTIKAANIGIYGDSAEGVRFAVHNHKGALIEGGGRAIDVDDRLVLKNEGKIKGDVRRRRLRQQDSSAAARSRATSTSARATTSSCSRARGRSPG